MQEVISAVLLVAGANFIFIAAIGLIRMPDLFMRMSSNTKAATLGVGLILLATAVHFGNLGVTSRALATIVFLFLTAPVAAHMIGRAAYSIGVPLWKGTVIDELKGRYKPSSPSSNKLSPNYRDTLSLNIEVPETDV